MTVDSPQKEKIVYTFSNMKTIDDLASLINDVATVIYKTPKPISGNLIKALAYSPRMKRYNSFEIKKKNGGVRVICAPNATLKRIQRCLNIIFQLFYEPNEAAFGFVPKRSVADNAGKHVGKQYVYNIDLKDFFTSISEGRIYKRLQAAPFNLLDEIASVIARLCCHSVEKVIDGKPVKCGVLPQGAPTSPILTNLVCQRLDRRLAGLANRFHLTYTRYADDITFSSNYNCYKESGKFVRELKRLISNESLQINTDKVRLQHRAYRQEVTGIIVNQKANVTKKYIQDIQLGLYFWEHYGLDRAEKIYMGYCANRRSGTAMKKPASLQQILQGKLLYMKMVKGNADSVYQKLSARFYKLNPQLVNADSTIIEDEKKDVFEQMLQMLENGGLDNFNPQIINS